jgi:hypothetical protein
MKDHIKELAIGFIIGIPILTITAIILSGFSL